jgi:enterochelin esterase family protein
MDSIADSIACFSCAGTNQYDTSRLSPDKGLEKNLSTTWCNLPHERTNMPTNRRMMTGVVLFLPFVITPSLSTADEAGTKAELQAVYDRLYSLIMKQDIPAALGLLAPDYSLEALDGTRLTRAKMEDKWKSSAAKVKSTGTARVKIEKLSIDGEKVRTKVHVVLLYTIADATDKSKDHDRFSDDRLQDTWLKTGSGWKLQHSEEVRANIGGALQPEAETADSPRLTALSKRIKERDVGALDAFWQEIKGKAPLVEPVPADDRHSYVTFLWHGDAGTRKVQLIGGLPEDGDKFLTRLGETDLWYRTEKITNKASFVYAFLVAGIQDFPGKESTTAKSYTIFTADPLNAHRFAFGSKIELPAAPPQPYFERRAGVAEGTLQPKKIQSEILKQERSFGVYLPAGYDPNAGPYNLLVLLDGQSYGNGPNVTVPTTTILDNLIAAGKIQPTVAVLVNNIDDESRSRDLRCSVPFAQFLANEIVPWVRSHYRVTEQSSGTAICGSSHGGLCAAFCGLNHSDVFGNVLSQSGSFYYTPDEGANSEPYLTQSGWLMEKFAKARKLPLRFYLQVGQLESGAGMVATNRHLRDILRLKGYPVTYCEIDGGHDALAWRGSLADGLIALIGTSRKN